MTTLPTTSHWGAFRAGPHPAGGVLVEPHPDDPAPSPLLAGVPGSLRHRTRVRRPAVREGWLRGGPGTGAGRGREPFVEVSWERALDLVAGELARVKREFGPQAVFGGSYGWASAGRFHHAQSQLHRFLALFGGYTASRNSYSLGTSLVLLPRVLGDAEAVLRATSSWPTIVRHTRLLVAFGGVPAKNVYVTPGGVTRHTTPGFLAELAAAGTEVTLVSPLRDDLPDGPATDWLPVAPGTDTALMLALTHTLVAENLHDRAFLARYTSGWPVLERYLDGRADGTPKDADWAAPICGLAAERIRALARKMAGTRTLVTVTWSLQRARYGEQPVWAAIALASALGQLGLPGGGFGHGYGSMGDVGDTGTALRLPFLPQPANPVDEFIPCARIADLLLHPGEEYPYDGTTRRYPDIRLVHWAGGNPFHHHQDLGRLRRAFARPETVIVHEPHWTATARHADIVLPVTTTLEREDFGGGRRDTHLIAMHRAADPVGEARDDHAILAALAERLGFAAEFTENRTPRQWLEHLYGQWAEQLRADGAEGAGSTGSAGGPPSFDRFWADGEWRLPEQHPERTLFAEFRADPDRHPLATPSGRIELHSPAIAALDLPDCPGHPAWLDPRPDPATARRHPLLLIANQPATRLHSQLDVGAASLADKVADREAVELHPADAAERAIGDGDLVRIFNDRGACLAGARLSDRLRPGVVRLPTGAWFDPVPDTEPPLCAHGNPNALTADLPSSRLSQGCTGQHAPVQLERWTGGDPPPVTVRHPPVLLPAPTSDPTSEATPDPASEPAPVPRPEHAPPPEAVR
ncbi:MULTISPECIES: molybdopterin-dependent oxidoreductase [Kitasatospora]|uniref:Putative biotin sulfoxide reductase n=1 Tax=Kitasatospora setae (strain ATCC 33774 / DSM 43861 / JCM 3304 / KCC A-0304 / NBRC 14216 / KM-6054) TaxID=452652 RepID=E4N5P2_KITSK|nr:MULTISPECIES: molybdopterin-dependent oxidoreductase [Kitasatospora]BAJ26523.1 putative biotin sulfoxide reductase [Kitasatospora setae KM-6054]